MNTIFLHPAINVRRRRTHSFHYPGSNLDFFPPNDLTSYLIFQRSDTILLQIDQDKFYQQKTRERIESFYKSLQIKIEIFLVYSFRRLSFTGLPRLFIFLNGTFYQGITKPFILTFTGVCFAQPLSIRLCSHSASTKNKNKLQVK